MLVTTNGERLTAHFEVESEKLEKASGFTGVKAAEEKWKVYIKVPGNSKQSFVGEFCDKFEVCRFVFKNRKLITVISCQAAAAYSREYEKLHKTKPRQVKPDVHVTVSLQYLLLRQILMVLSTLFCFISAGYPTEGTYSKSYFLYTW